MNIPEKQGSNEGTQDKETKFEQFKESRLGKLGSGNDDVAARVLDVVLHAKEPLLVEQEDLHVAKEHVAEHMRNLAAIYAPLINSVLDNETVSRELARARINVDWAERDMLQSRESDAGGQAAQLYDEAAIAEMYGKMAVAKNFLKNPVLLRSSAWHAREGYKQKLEIWATALVDYQYWVNIAEKTRESKKYWESDEGKKRAEELSTTQRRREAEVGSKRSSEGYPDRSDDIVSQGLIGLGPLKDTFGP